MSGWWSAPVCFHCWHSAQQNPHRQPVRVLAPWPGNVELCHECGRFTIEGIFVRARRVMPPHPPSPPAEDTRPLA